MSRDALEPRSLTPSTTFDTTLSRTPSGLLLTSSPGEACPRSLCRSHSGTLLGPVALTSLKRKPSLSPQITRNTLRKKAHINLSIDIPPLWLPPIEDTISPPRPMSEQLCMSEEGELARAWVRNHKASIRLLAVDFDLTCIDINTNGMWPGTASQLALHFRAPIREAMLEGIQQGMKLAVVTFSGQKELIRQVLQEALGDGAAHVMVRAGMPHLVGSSGLGHSRNKQGHILSVMEELAQRHGEFLEMSQVMLVDDDFTNVADARGSGCVAAWFNPEEALSFVCDMCQSQEISMFACSTHSCAGATQQPISPGAAMITA